MKIPTDFDLADIITDQKVAPPPRKPRLQKHDIFMDIKKFKAIDDHAIKVSCNVIKSCFKVINLK